MFKTLRAYSMGEDELFDEDSLDTVYVNPNQVQSFGPAPEEDKVTYIAFKNAEVVMYVAGTPAEIKDILTGTKGLH